MAFGIGGEPVRLAWERDPVAMSADDALAIDNGHGEERGRGPEPEARNAAKGWLRDLLAGGAMESATIKDKAKAAGFAWRTVHRAKDELGIKPYREQFGGASMWKLPPDPPCRNLSCHVPETENNLASWHDSKNQRENDGFNVAQSLPCQDKQHVTIGTNDAHDGRERGEI